MSHKYELYDIYETEVFDCGELICASDDYEDIMEWTVSGNTEKTTIAMVNGFAVEDEKREVRLLN